jgi:hypothetical protein
MALFHLQPSLQRLHLYSDNKKERCLYLNQTTWPTNDDSVNSLSLEKTRRTMLENAVRSGRLFWVLSRVGCEEWSKIRRGVVFGCGAYFGSPREASGSPKRLVVVTCYTVQERGFQKQRQRLPKTAAKVPETCFVHVESVPVRCLFQVSPPDGASRAPSSFARLSHPRPKMLNRVLALEDLC